MKDYLAFICKLKIQNENFIIRNFNIKNLKSKILRDISFILYFISNLKIILRFIIKIKKFIKF